MYSFSTRLEGELSAIEQRVVNALQEEGFGVLTEIDVQATLKKKLGIDKRPYKILGACNPTFANQALEAESGIGLLLPCNVVLREEECEMIRVAIMDPVAVLQLVDREEIGTLAKEVPSRLERVKQALGEF